MAAAPGMGEIAERVRRVLLVFRRELDQDQPKEADDMEALRDIDAAYEKWERGVLRAARHGALADAIRALCSQFDIALTDQRQVRLEAMDPGELQQQLVRISVSRVWPE